MSLNPHGCNYIFIYKISTQNYRKLIIKNNIFYNKYIKLCLTLNIICLKQII